MFDDEFVRLRRLLATPGVGIQRILALRARFGSFGALFGSSFSDLTKTPGISDALANSLLLLNKDLPRFRENVLRENELLGRIQGRCTSLWDDDYPSILKNIYNPPLILYMTGNIPETDRIAVVGTRLPTEYGREIAQQFSSEIAIRGIAVVSGMARGIDSIAHRAALSEGGKTIAVIGSGLDVIYPPENRSLYDRIREQGAVLTEYDPGTPPNAQNFPKRNRIISGLSLGTLIIETKINGGAMHTASYALDQNREVFAVPGPISSRQSEGTNALIKRCSAKLVTSVDDIFEEIFPKDLFQGRKEKLSQVEQRVFEALSGKEEHIEDISIKTGIESGELLSALLSLELKGLIRQLPGKYFSRV